LGPPRRLRLLPLLRDPLLRWHELRRPPECRRCQQCHLATWSLHLSPRADSGPTPFLVSVLRATLPSVCLGVGEDSRRYSLQSLSALNLLHALDYEKTSRQTATLQASMLAMTAVCPWWNRYFSLSECKRRETTACSKQWPNCSTTQVQLLCPG
jgi:hypothetical protein